MPTHYVEEYTDGDDDEVMEVPYVKPKPPMITLSASEDEDETEDNAQFLTTNAKATSKKGSRSKKERKDHNVSGSSDHSMSKKNDSCHNTPKTSKKSRSSKRQGNVDDDVTLLEQSNLSGKDHHNNSDSMSLSTDTPEIERTPELSQNVEPGVELKSTTDSVGTNSTTRTRSSEVVTHSGSSIDGNLGDSQRRTNNEGSDESVPLIHVSTDIFEAGFTPSSSVCSSLSTDDNISTASQGISISPGIAVGASAKGKKRTRSSPGSSRNPRKKSSVNSALEQSRSDLLKFMQHLGLPLQELPALDTPAPARKRTRKVKTPTQEVSLPEASPTASLVSSGPPSAFVSTTEESRNSSPDAGCISPKKIRPPRKKARTGESLDEGTEEIVFTNKDLESVTSDLQMNVINSVRRSNNDKEVIASSSKSPSALKARGSKLSDIDKIQETKSKRFTASSRNTPESDKLKSSTTGLPSTQSTKGKETDTRKRLRNPLCESKNSDSPKQSPNTRNPGIIASRQRSERNLEALKIYPKKWTIAMIKYYGTIKSLDYTCEDVQSRQSHTAMKWRVPEDKSRRSDRYTQRIRCTNCNQMGHASYDCPDKRKPKMCSFCGWIGHTADDGGRNCPNALCLNCGVSQSRFQIACEKCLYKTRPIQCNLCGVVGHVDTTCPDLWRRYHSTTTNTAVNEENFEGAPTSRTRNRESNVNKKTYKPAYIVYCSNCGKKGHNYYRCTSSRYKSPCHPNKPFVINDLPPPPIRNAREPEKTTLRSHDTGTEALNQRKVTPIVDSASSVEMLTIQFDNPRLPVTENHNSTSANSSGGNISDNVNHYCPDVESQVIIGLSTVEHRHLLRAIEEKRANDLFNNICERQVNINVFKEKCEVHLSGSEEGVDQARLDIFKLLLKLKATDICHKKSKRPSEVFATNNDTTELNSSVTASEDRQILDHTKNDTINATVTSSFPSFLGTHLRNNIQNQNTTRNPNLSTSFQEDELPNMFDIDERVLTGNQKILATMSMLQPTGPFSAGPHKEYIPIPVPVPVPVADFASYTSGPSSSHGHGFNTFDPRVLPQAQAIARAYYQSSLEFPHLPQVLPTLFDTSINCSLNASVAVPTPTVPVQEPLQDPQKSPALSPHREDSPELEIIGEVTSRNASSSGVEDRSSTEPRKLNNVRGTLTVTLLHSEWALFCVDKTQLLNNISKSLKVDISLDKGDMIISIKGTSKESRRLAQQKILEFLQAKAAGLPFNLCLTPPPPGSDEQESDSKKDSNTNENPGQSLEDAVKLQSGPWPSSMPPTFPSRHRDSSHFDQNRNNNRYYNNHRNYDSGYQGSHEEYDARSDNRGNFHAGSRNFREMDYRPPHRQQRNYYSGNRDRRYERNYNPPHVSSDRHQGPNNYKRSQRYFN